MWSTLTRHLINSLFELCLGLELKMQILLLQNFIAGTGWRIGALFFVCPHPVYLNYTLFL